MLYLNNVYRFIKKISWESHHFFSPWYLAYLWRWLVNKNLQAKPSRLKRTRKQTPIQKGKEADTTLPNRNDKNTQTSPARQEQTNRTAATAFSSGVNPALWKKIETHINTSTTKEDATMKEVMTVMGKDWHYDITQLWFFVQFNKKKRLSTGVKGLTEANFYDQYDREYEIAIKGGF